jgi:hypothetical protein
VRVISGMTMNPDMADITLTKQFTFSTTVLNIELSTPVTFLSIAAAVKYVEEEIP